MISPLTDSSCFMVGMVTAFLWSPIHFSVNSLTYDARHSDSEVGGGGGGCLHSTSL